MSTDPNEPSVIDPVCGRPVDPLRARAVGIFGGTTYYFCSAECKAGYSDPRRAERQPESNGTAQIVAPAAAAPAARPATPSEPAVAPTATKSRAPVFVIVIAGAAAAGAAAWFYRGSTPVPPPAPVAAPPVAAPAPPPAPPEPPKPPAEKPTVLGELAPPVKLGLRRFVEEDGDRAFFVARLLVIEANGHSTPVEIARVPVAGDVVKAIRTDAVAAAEAYASATAEPGAIFADTVALGEAGRLELRVARAAEGLVAETRTVPTDAKGEGPAWERRMFAPLPAEATVRGAAFAKKRYLPDTSTAPSSE